MSCSPCTAKGRSRILVLCFSPRILGLAKGSCGSTAKKGVRSSVQAPGWQLMGMQLGAPEEQGVGMESTGRAGIHRLVH